MSSWAFRQRLRVRGGPTGGGTHASLASEMAPYKVSGRQMESGFQHGHRGAGIPTRPPGTAGLMQFIQPDTARHHPVSSSLARRTSCWQWWH